MKSISIEEFSPNTEDNSNQANVKKKDTKNSNLDRAISKDELMRGIQEDIKEMFRKGKK